MEAAAGGRRVGAALAGATVALLAGCASAEVVRLAAFDAALAAGPTLDEPRILFAEDLPGAPLPDAVPFAAIHVRGAGDRESFALLAASEARSQGLAPDLIVVGSVETVMTGAYAQSLYLGPGYASAFAMPTASNALACALLRIPGASLGLELEANGAIRAVDPASGGHAAGLLEGDTLLTVDGRPTELLGGPVAQRAFWPDSLGWEPGQVLALEWIRPGSGRMGGALRAIACAVPPELLELPTEAELRAASLASSPAGEL